MLDNLLAKSTVNDSGTLPALEITDPDSIAVLKPKNHSAQYDNLGKYGKRFCQLYSYERELALAMGYTEETYNAVYAPDMPRFSITHITKVFKEVYDMDVVSYRGGYKAGRGRRFTPYRLRYPNGEYVRDPSTNEILTFTIPQMGQFLVNNGDY